MGGEGDVVWLGREGESGKKLKVMSGANLRICASVPFSTAWVGGVRSLACLG